MIQILESVHVLKTVENMRRLCMEMLHQNLHNLEGRECIAICATSEKYDWCLGLSINLLPTSVCFISRRTLIFFRSVITLFVNRMHS
jgi:hypothetical protein